MSSTIESDEEQIPGLRANGTPDPAYAAALGLVPTSPGLRSLAFIIDAAIAVVLAIPAVIGVAALQSHIDDVARMQLAGLIVPLVLYGAGEFLLTVYYVVQLILHGRRGVTIGKAICGIRSVRATTFAAPGFWRMVLRALVFAAACILIPIIGGIVVVLSSLWDYEHRGRGWLDRIGGNWLVNVRKGLDPFNAKALRLARKRVAAPPKEDAASLPSLATGAGATRFVPDVRSSSAVVGFSGRAEADQPVGEPWTPPTLGAPRQPETPQAAPVHAQPAVAETQTLRGATLVFDDGASIVVVGDGLFGRDPQPHEGEERYQLIPVHDERMQISKTHAVFGIDTGGLWIRDRASVNGTTVLTPDGQRVDVSADEQYPVSWGSVIEMGGRAIRVERQKAAAESVSSPTPRSEEGE